MRLRIMTRTCSTRVRRGLEMSLTETTLSMSLLFWPWFFLSSVTLLSVPFRIRYDSIICAWFPDPDLIYSLDRLPWRDFRISDEQISNLFACPQGLCNEKFELKVNNVRFVGHPIMVLQADYGGLRHGPATLGGVGGRQNAPVDGQTVGGGVRHGGTEPQEPPTQMLNVVFVLKAQASHEIVQQYHDLSKKIATSICKWVYPPGRIRHSTSILLYWWVVGGERS